MKRINASVYTEGKFGKGFRETLDTSNPFLYSGGVYPTKIQVQDLPEYYCKIHSRSIWYMTGYVKTAGVKYVDYKYIDENHLFKDDRIFISYDKPIRTKKNDWGFLDYYDYDIAISGNDIIPLLFFIEKYSPDVDTFGVRAKIKEKFQLYKKNYYDDFKRQFKDDDDIFEVYKQYMHYHIINKR